MTKPKTIEEFKALIESMEHRERFVFELVDQSDIRYYMEVYATETAIELGNRLVNVNYQMTNPLGKFIKGNPKTNQMLHITTLKWLDRAIYSRIR